MYIYPMKPTYSIIDKHDYRRLPSSERNILRNRGISLIKSGLKKSAVAALLGTNKFTVSRWWSGYKAAGVSVLDDKKRGAISENCMRLTNAQGLTIQKLITDKYPEQYKLPFALWTRKAVKELILREFGIDLAITTVGYYLRRWGFTPQKPQKRAYEQNPAKVKRWLSEQYPAIKVRAKEENAEIHWGDETGCKNQCHHGRSYAPKGKTPVKEYMSKRFKVNMISTITNQGKVQFMIYSESMNADKFIEFLQQLIKSSERKIFLILDNLRVHHSQIVKDWVAQEEIAEKIELFFLPSYSPERNPDEYLNCDLKQGLSEKPAPKNVEKLRENVETHMRMLQQNQERVKKYFKHEMIQYAA
jgi:transposase